MTRFKLWWNRTFYCSFWDCEPEENGTWWRTADDTVVVLPDATLHCKRCGGHINAEAR